MKQLDVEKCLNDLEQTGWTQLIHDRDFHQDINCLSSKDKMYHLTLHLGKYAPTVVSREGEVNFKVLADMFIITTSMANAMRVSVRQTWTSILNRCALVSEKDVIRKESLFIDTLTYMSSTVAKLCKVCEGLDHLENVNPRATAADAIDRIFRLIFTLWVDALDYEFDSLLKMVCRRLLGVEMQAPHYLYIKREQERVAKPIAIREYVELPMHETAMLKELSTDNWVKYNKFNNTSFLMVMSAPALMSLERKGLIHLEVNGLYTVTDKGKQALHDIV